MIINNMLTPEELKRYNRHLILSEFGREAQEKLKKASALIVGAGGLGSPVLQYLAAAGIGTIGIVDGDTIDESNLQRQVIYSQADVGAGKAHKAAHQVNRQNPHVHVNTHEAYLTSENALEIISLYDVVVDGSDNFATRYLVNDACVIAGKPLVFGSIFKFEGQVTVFNYDNGPTYRCLFPEPPKPGEVPSCSEIGVIGVLPGIVGTLMANETIKLIAGIGELLSGRLLIMDALSMQFSSYKFKRNDKEANVTELIDYEQFCNPTQDKPETPPSMTALEFQRKATKDWQLIDVREPFEYEIVHLPDSKLIPLNQITTRYSEIEKDKPTLVYCHHGMRSAMAIRFLEEQGFDNLVNLEGGIDAWATDVDEGMVRY